MHLLIDYYYLQGAPGDVCTRRKTSTSQEMSKLRKCQNLKHQGQGQENKILKLQVKKIKTIKNVKNKSMLVIKSDKTNIHSAIPFRNSFTNLESFMKPSSQFLPKFEFLSRRQSFSILSCCCWCCSGWCWWRGRADLGKFNVSRSWWTCWCRYRGIVKMNHVNMFINWFLISFLVTLYSSLRGRGRGWYEWDNWGRQRIIFNQLYMICQIDDSSCCHDTIQKADQKNCNLEVNLQIITTALIMVDKNGSSAHNAATYTPNHV